ncbi:regulatory protein, luxR family [Micromonospora rhizosphaerae]|uniref:Regulatory protein, luxR family n=1 Tax=Micromonospora rhizosphaerae TaxID=568872 RepID=A0A1C6SX40_9ACTN|nr:regulatory protein, luxR family [Micromonospora rhizosphaerae]
MRRDEALLRASMDAARLVAAGHDYVEPFIAAVGRAIDADAGAGFTRWSLAEGEVATVTVTVWDAAPLPQHYIDAARAVASRHPCFLDLRSGRGWAQRVSDHVDLPRFWHTETYHWMHSWTDGRYPAGLHLGARPDQVVFLGVHRRHRDFEADEMAALSLVREPLASALAFRRELDAAAARLVGPESTNGGGDTDRLTPRERDVLALVAQGWTNQRIGRRLGITERTVRKHLECGRDKIGASSRAEAAAWWARTGSR